MCHFNGSVGANLNCHMTSDKITIRRWFKVDYFITIISYNGLA